MLLLLYIKTKKSIITFDSILQMFYYTRQNESNYTVILYNFAVAKRCSSNLGIHVSISFTPAIRNARFEKTFTSLQGDLQSFVQPYWEHRPRPYSQFV